VLLTAQHVVSPTNRREGVNAFLYLHQGLPAVDEAALEQATTAEDAQGVTLVAQSISVPPPGNRVRSYLDIFSPDEIRWSEVRVELMAFVGRSQLQPLPWRARTGRCAFRLGMESELSHEWISELATLYQAALALWLAHPR
jgi:hypothetical protein